MNLKSSITQFVCCPEFQIVEADMSMVNSTATIHVHSSIPQDESRSLTLDMLKRLSVRDEHVTRGGMPYDLRGYFNRMEMLNIVEVDRGLLCNFPPPNCKHDRNEYCSGGCTVDVYVVDI